MNELGTDQIASIGKENVINPKHLTCSICYCLYSDGRECMNKKCKKLFCNLCANEKLVSTNTNKNNCICPFCRTDTGFTVLDENLTEILRNLKVFCKRETCNGLFTLYEYKEHLYQCKPLVKKTCSKCKKRDSSQKCEICAVSYCSSCRTVGKCNNCKASICQSCSTYANTNLPLHDFLCGICEINCKNCSQEAKNVCYLCKKYLCGNCSKKCEECKYFICSDADACFKSKIPVCELCRNIPMNSFYNKCGHVVYSECNKCYVKCKGMFKLDKSLLKCEEISNRKCNNCQKEICTTHCANKCRLCKESSCSDCFKTCSVCKKSQCVNCLDLCGIIVCLDCDADIIRKCSRDGCNTRLCLECWNVCESCGAIYCEKHSYNCIKCEGKCCASHFNNCKLCNDAKNPQDNYRKLCLKNCTNTCSFCHYVTNDMCYPANHQNNIVTKLNCGHKICKNCLTKCGKCKNVAVSCPKCITSYYFHKCRRCECYLCSTCSIYCAKCEDVFCSIDHMCDGCKKYIIKKCLNCIVVRRTKCPCGEKLKICEICSKKVICNYECGKNKNFCINKCRMFYCNDNCFLKFKNMEFEEKLKNKNNLNEKKINLDISNMNEVNRLKENNNIQDNQAIKFSNIEKVTTCSCCLLY